MTTKKIAIIVAVVVVGGAGFMYWRRRSAAMRVGLPAASAVTSQAPGAVILGAGMSPKVARKKQGGRFARIGGRALRGGLRVGAIAGVPGAAQGQEVLRAVS